MSNDTPHACDGSDRITSRSTTSRRSLLTALGGGVVGMSLVSGAADAQQSSMNENHIETPVDAGGMEHDEVMALVPDSEVTHRAVDSGSWQDDDVWEGGSPPGDSARVLIERGVTVTLDHRDSARLKTVRVDGALRFAPETDTALQVETLVTTPGSVLQIGREDDPIERGSTAQITFVDLGPIDESWDSERVSKGLNAMGAVRMHGAEKSSWHTLATPPEPGTKTLTLSERPTGWEPGDRVVVPGTNPDDNEDEEALIATVDGKTVTLDRNLEYDHAPPREDFDSYVLNLDRNVRLRSENDAVTRRGHVMIMSEGVDVEYAGFYDLGRTDKNYPFANPVHGTAPEDVEPNPRARYSFHFHKTGPFVEEPHTVNGCVVWGSPGWGFVNHRSYAEFTNCVSYDVFGAGFVTEEGNERGAFKGNFALRSEGSGEALDSREFRTTADRGPGHVDDFGHGGHGFWFQGPAVAVEGNVAAGHRYYAYVYWNRSLVPHELGPDDEINRFGTNHRNFPVEFIDGQESLKKSDRVADGKVPSQTVRLESFTDNTAFASAGGMDMSRHMMTWEHDRIHDWSVIDGFTVYNIGTFTPNWQDEPLEPSGAHSRGGNSAITFRFNNNVRIRNSTFVSGEGRDGFGINRQIEYPANISIENCEFEGFELGLQVPNSGVTRCFGTRFANEKNISVHRPFDGAKVKLWDLTFERGSNGHVSMETPPMIEQNRPGLLFDESDIKLDDRQVFFNKQRPDYVPVPSQEAIAGHEEQMEELMDGDDDASAVIGKTNQELMDQYGVAVNGRIAQPSQTTSDSRVSGGLIATEHEPPRKAWIEAEDGSLDSPWVTKQSDGAANGEYITIDSGDGTSGSDATGHATYEFDAAPGEYTVYGRVSLPDDDNNGFQIRIDDGEWVSWQPDQWMRPKITWEWKIVGPHWEPATFELSGETHTLEVKYQDAGAKLDKLFVTQSERKPIVYGGNTQGGTGGDDPSGDDPDGNNPGGNNPSGDKPEDGEPLLDAIDANDNGTIDDGELLDVIRYWKDSEPVPGHGDPPTDNEILTVIGKWKNGP